jgi:hypothetical protein
VPARKKCSIRTDQNVPTFLPQQNVPSGKIGESPIVRAAPEPLKYLFLKDLAGNDPKNKPKIPANSFIHKYFTGKSLFLKDLAAKGSQVFDSKRPSLEGSTALSAEFPPNWITIPA